SKHLFESFVCDQVDDERLALFHANPETNGPKLRNSYLDKRGSTTKAILDDSLWNQALMHKLATEAAAIVKACQDDRFGKISHEDWFAMIRVRIQPILKTDLEARPRTTGES
ncbi:hypothetical protein K435DRAFT_584183, partial [Dendrothele bispora CBS 962.96]